jgi:septal ring factor EnvC (AmiA/AmiB activator)
MNRIIAVAAVVGLLIGVFAGFLWWGMPTEQVQSELREAQKRVSELERQLAESQAQSRKVEAGLKTLETRLKTTEEDLRVERDRRSKLEMILSKGRK